MAGLLSGYLLDLTDVILMSGLTVHDRCLLICDIDRDSTKQIHTFCHRIEICGNIIGDIQIQILV